VVQRWGAVAACIYSAAGPGESSTDLVFSGRSLIAENGVTLAEAQRFDFATNSILADVDVERLHQDRLHSTSFRDATATEAPWRKVAFAFGNGPMIKKGKDLHRVLNAHPFVPSSQADRSAVCQEIFSVRATGLARRLRAVKAKTLVLGLSGGCGFHARLAAWRRKRSRAAV